MALNRYGNKRDANEADIFKVLRAFGMSVHALDTPCDCIIGFRGISYLVEIKDGPKKLTPSQVKFSEAWQGQYTILRSVDDAIAWGNKLKGG